MHLKIFYPGGVSYGVVNDDAGNDELYNALYLAATKEQGNGSEKVRNRKSSEDERRKTGGGFR